MRETPSIDSKSACQCPHDATRGVLYAVIGWLTAAILALSVSVIPFDFGESLCGVWGCLPPLPALVAMHLFWCVVFSAGVWTVCRWWPFQSRRIGIAILIIAFGLCFVVIGRDIINWLSLASPEDAHFWPRRMAYTIATQSDLPLLQSILAGAMCLIPFKRS
jgi:hypothetical protein